MADLAERADALWRAIAFLSVAQLHFQASPIAIGQLGTSDLKRRPSGHWGTVPGTAWALAHAGLAAGCWPELEVIPVLGAGHAGVVQRALAWLTGDLAKVSPASSRDAAGLTALVSSFPDAGDLGSEVHPSLPGGAYMGGWLGGALAFAQGMALDAPARVVIPILGDGECETPTTAAAWLAQRALTEAHVLPVVHLNGQRMGGQSLLGAMSDEEVIAYMRGLGWKAVMTHVTTGDPAEHSAFHSAMVTGLDAARRGERQVIFLRCVKGWSGPTGEHKTPLTDPAGDPRQRAALSRWLASYRPSELLDNDGQPIGSLAAALDGFRLFDPPEARSAAPGCTSPAGRGFSAEVSAVLRQHAAFGAFKIFSPDELRSNRLGGPGAGALGA
ncbi:MAG TPA: hypothetical protein VMV92_20010 [Streptosporangiaceae bacterium]|nr:hypothetical protein [Streptosporangiaceae bacterium]